MQILKGRRGVTKSVAFSPDGTLLASASSNHTVCLWDLVSGKARQTWTIPEGGWRHQIAFSPEGHWLVATADRCIHVYDLRTEQEARSLRGGPAAGELSSLAFAPDGKSLVVGGYNRPGRGWRVWRTDTWKEESAVEGTSSINGVCNISFSPDGSTLALFGYSGLLLCSPQGKELACWEVKHSASSKMPLAFSPDGRFLVYSPGSVLTVRNLATGPIVAELCQKRTHFQGMAFAPNGRLLVTVSNDGRAKNWDTATWKERGAFAWDIGMLRCVAFAPDGMRAAAGNDQGKIIIWDVDE